MIVEANPSDTGALETLKEIYTKLGDRERLAHVVAPRRARRRARLRGGGRRATRCRRARRGGRRPAVGARRAAERPIARLGDRLVAEGLITPSSSQRALAEQKGTRDKLGQHPRPA